MNHILETLNRVINDVNNIKHSLDVYTNNSITDIITIEAHSKEITDVQDALCETSIEVDDRITTIEDALCELSKEE